MLQTGIVKEINATTAYVEIERSSSCGSSCAECGLCPGQKTLVKALNSANADVGNTVIISMADKKILGAAFLVYIVPLVFLIAGYFAGSAVFSKEAFAILTGFAAMAAAFLIIISADKKIKHRYTPSIVKIIENEDNTGQR